MEKIKLKRKEKRKKKSFFLLVLFMGTLCLQASAQELTISISMKNVSLHEILLEIKKQSGKNLAYNNNLIEKYRDETIELKDATFEEAIKKALEGKGLQYKIVDDVFVIEPADEKQKTDQPKGLNQTIKGTVYDAGTNIPLIGATVVIVQSDPFNGSTTDIDGNYKITNVPIGRQAVEVSYIGYKKRRIDNIMVLSAKENVLDIGLEESVEKLDEVKITANNKNDAINDMAAVSARSFTIEETERFAGSLGDPARMATNYAGVFTAGDQRNDIIIRGNSPSGLLWQLEDIPIPSPNHFDVNGTTGGPVSMLNNNLLARSDFFTSAFPSEYGNATSGVFDLKMRNGNYEKHEFLLQCGMNGFEAGAEGPVSRKNKSSYIINARYSMLGLLQNLLWVEGMPQYQDASFKLNFPLKSGRLSVFGIGGTSLYTEYEDDTIRSDHSNEYATKNSAGSKTFIAGINYLHIINQGTSIKTAIAYSSRGPHEVVDSTLNEKSYLHLDDNDFKQTNLTLISKLTKKFNAMNIVTIGFIIQDISFKANRMTSYYEDSLLMGKPYSLSKKNLILSQGYVQTKHNFTDQLSLNAGVNILWFQYNNTSAIDPRLGLSWQFADKQGIGLGYGLHSQMQPVNVYFIQSKTGIDADGRQVYTDLGNNKNLDFTRSHQFAVSHNYSFNPNLRLKTEVYYQYLFNVPVKYSKGYFSMINTGAAQSVPEEDSLVNKGHGKNYGIEFTFEKFLSRNYYFLITSSLFNSLYQGADKKWRNTAYNGHYVFNVLGGYEFELKENVLLNLNLRTVYAGGRRIIPFDYEKSKEENDTHYLYDQAYEKQVKNYFRVDFRMGVIFQRKRTTHELAIDISNITNRKNVSREKYNKTYYQQGIFPMGLYRLNF
jgi:hypothetical protein